MLKDRYGNALSTASAAARDAYVRGVESLMAATPGTDTAFADSIAADEGFALGHISLARAKQLMGRGHEAKAPRARALELAAGTTPREQSQIAIFDKILTGQGEAALAAIREHIKDWPRDAMALAPATSVFGLIGFSGRVGRERTSSRCSSRSRRTMATTGGTARSLPSRRSSSACSTRASATSSGARRYPQSAHAAHIRGHLYYERGEREAGLAFLTDWMKDYPRDGLMHCHNNWHKALWSMETGRQRRRLAHLQRGAAARRRLGAAGQCRDRLPGLPAARRDGGRAAPARAVARAREYSTQWFGRPGLSFVDMHTVLAYAMAGDDEKLAPSSTIRAARPGDMVPPMARGFAAYARGDFKTRSPRSSPCSPPTSGWAAAARNATCWNTSSPRAGRSECPRSSPPPHNAKPRPPALKTASRRTPCHRSEPYRPERTVSSERPTNVSSEQRGTTGPSPRSR
jgi:hypothetical protein